MKIKSIKLKDFKRFTDLTIEGLPETAKLVVMIGPNGSGKSSVFDALQVRAYLGSTFTQDVGYNLSSHRDYYIKSNYFGYCHSYHKRHQQTQIERMNSYTSLLYTTAASRIIESIAIDFQSQPTMEYQWHRCVRVRSAYRNDLMTTLNSIDRVNPAEERQLANLTENDESVASNYWWLAYQWQERGSEIGQSGQNLVNLQEKIFGELRDAIGRLFNDPPLVLKNLGNPLDGDLFQFDKGTSERFSFQNLASGEKAALDLLLDIIVTKAEYDETIICIDEPEAHIHTKLQGQLLKELYNLIPEKSQLWIATHSIGMVRKAQELWRADPNSVVFLDFGKDKFGKDRDFDGPVKIEPAKPNPNFWTSTYEVALGDLAELVTPQRIVLCESKAQDPTKAFDAACYNQIFGSRYPDTRFISIGNNKEVERADTHLIPVIQAIATGTEIFRLRDGDDATPEETKEDAEKGISTLSRRNIEGYLFDDEVLTKLCEDHGKPDKIQDLLDAKQTALQKSIAEGGHPENLKPIAQKIHHAARNALKSSRMGNSKESFMRNILAPLIQQDMKVYEQLEKDIFGE